jgi:hypothetical protein
MSFGLDIVTKDLDGNEHWIDVVDGHTYNLAPMWCKALPMIENTRDLDGKKCADILTALDAGLLDATKNARDYEALNPSNGWGDYAGFYQIVRWNG